MAKLTRTQKFADLRESLANDKESSLSTKDLSNYENRLNNLTSQDSFERSEREEIRKVPEEDPRYIWTAFEDTNDTEVYSHSEDNHTTDSYIWNSLQEMPETHTEEEAVTDFVLENPFEDFDEILAEKKKDDNPLPVQEAKPLVVDAHVVEKTPEVEETPHFEDTVLPHENNVEENPVNEPVETTETVIDEVPTAETPIYEAPVYETPVYEETPVEHVDVVEEELDADEVEPQKDESNQYMGLYHANPEIEAAYEEAAKRAEEEAEKVVEETPVVEQTPVEAPVLDDEIPDAIFVEEAVDNHEADHSNDVDNHIIHETISEVDQYNSAKGEQTISTLTNNMVNEVRHRSDNREPKYEEVPINETAKTSDAFSNTVSMEISKIMNDISNTEEIKETPVKEEVAEAAVEEHPVLAKAIEDEVQEDVVEIKNINELEQTPTQNTISSTIPFVVAASDDEEIIDDDLEEDSNTILNIILVILIVILVAVLGLIVFYILKTKGII